MIGDKMKVLSLKEPYASLIKEGKKKIETRSWKTNYRGIIYIHASKTRISKEDRNNAILSSLIDYSNLNYGYIICKANLKDCILMDEDFVNDMRKSNPTEYACGIYASGRYAWILSDIEVLKEPIPAKGSLGLWNY